MAKVDKAIAYGLNLLNYNALGLIRGNELISYIPGLKPQGFTLAPQR